MDVATEATGIVLAWSGVMFAQRRPRIEAPGLIGAARDMAQGTGLGWLKWLGRLDTYQSAIAFGGCLLALTAVLRFAARRSETSA